MANYLSLDEAAAKLGIPHERLVALRSQGEVRGFRDGTSWKFPEDEIERLAIELGDSLSGGSGVLVSDSGSAGSRGGRIIGADSAASDQESGSDVEIGGESLQPGTGSDVNLIAAEGEGSDVAIIAGDSDLLMESGGSDLLEIDSGELQLQDPVNLQDSGLLDLAIEPNAGSTGPVTDEELKQIIDSHPDVLSSAPDPSGSGSGSMLDIGGGSDDLPLDAESDLSFPGLGPDADSDDQLIGDEDSEFEAIGSDIQQVGSQGASSLELMGDLDGLKESGLGSLEPRSADVLSELDLLGAEQKESGLITGDSENLLASSGLGSSIGAGNFKDSDLGGLDDALADDDDLVIADDDDDLVISNAGSDISVAGDSGINLMSPSDSGLSLESEPLDLAGSSISALDLGAELSEGGSSGSGSDGSGSVVDFQADEEFQLSPSGVGLDADIESGSQVIEVEDSEAIGEPVEFSDVAMGEPMEVDVFGAEPEASDAFAVDDEGEAVEIDESTSATVAPSPLGGYEVPFTLLQCITLMLILCVMGVGGMLLTDLVRNMWAYSEPSAPVSSLTDSLIGLMGWGQ